MVLLDVQFCTTVIKEHKYIFDGRRVRNLVKCPFQLYLGLHLEESVAERDSNTNHPLSRHNIHWVRESMEKREPHHDSIFESRPIVLSDVAIIQGTTNQITVDAVRPMLLRRWFLLLKRHHKLPLENCWQALQCKNVEGQWQVCKVSQSQDACGAQVGKPAMHSATSFITIIVICLAFDAVVKLLYVEG